VFAFLAWEEGRGAGDHLARFAKRFRPGEILDINSKIGMTSGNVVYYDLQVVTNSRRTFPLASGIRDKREAQWLAAEMLRLLQSDKSRAVSAVEP
jgi:hypothetical protein